MSEQNTNPTEEQPQNPAGLNTETGEAPSAGPVSQEPAKAEEEPSETKKTRKGFFGKKKTPAANQELEELSTRNDELTLQNEALRSESAEWKDKYLRLFSEFDNFRKRNARERIELAKTASSGLIVKLLPVLDDFERALKSLPADNETTLPYRQGIDLIYNKMLSALEKEGLKPLQSLGEAFDTDFHEALTNIPAPSEELKGKVVDEIERGYLLNDKVIRFAKVVVGN